MSLYIYNSFEDIDKFFDVIDNILENNLFDFRTINLKSNINHLIKLISRQNQLKQTNLKDIDKATDILYLSINFN